MILYINIYKYIHISNIIKAYPRSYSIHPTITTSPRFLLDPRLAPDRTQCNPTANRTFLAIDLSTGWFQRSPTYGVCVCVSYR